MQQKVLTRKAPLGLRRRALEQSDANVIALNSQV